MKKLVVLENELAISTSLLTYIMQKKSVLAFHWNGNVNNNKNIQRAITYIVVITNIIVRLTPIAASKDLSPKKMVE